MSKAADLTSYARQAFALHRVNHPRESAAERSSFVALGVGAKAAREGWSEKDLLRWLQSAYSGVWVRESDLNPGLDAKDVRSLLLKAWRRHGGPRVTEQRANMRRMRELAGVEGDKLEEWRQPIEENSTAARTFKFKDEAEDFIRDWFLQVAEKKGLVPGGNPNWRPRLRKPALIYPEDSPKAFKRLQRLLTFRPYMDLVYKYTWRGNKAYLITEPYTSHVVTVPK